MDAPMAETCIGTQADAAHLPQNLRMKQAEWSDDL
jgi:hypothetical protein